MNEIERICERVSGDHRCHPNMAYIPNVHKIAITEAGQEILQMHLVCTA
jgi:hypothetical protein